MKRLAYSLSYPLLLVPALVPLMACTGGERANSGQCPTGEVCSPRTPNGLHFIGRALADDILLTGPAATAVGGTQDVAIQYDRGDGVLIALDLPFTIDDDGGLGVHFDHMSGSVATVTGAGSRANYLRVLDASDNTLFDRKQLTGAALDTIALVDTGFERIPVAAQLVWAPGSQNVGIALYGQVQGASGPRTERIVDDTMTATLGGADRTAWDTFHVPNAAVGTSTVTVVAGDKPAAALDFTVVAQADALEAISPPATIHANGSQEVCFQATNTARYIVGLDWSFLVDGAAAPTALLSRNCITATTTKTTGTVSIQATAGGQSKTVTLAVSAMARQLPALVTPTRSGNGRDAVTAGDRAAM